MGSTASDPPPELRLAGNWDTLLQSESRAALEQVILPAYLPQQRWFGAKSRQIQTIRLVDQAILHTSATPAFLLLAQIDFADGATDLYFLPVAVATGPGSLVLARLVGPQGSAVLYDAIADVDLCRALLTAIAEGRTVPTQHGNIRATATSAFAAVRGPAHEVLPVTLRPPTSSNSLVCFGDRILLKLFRRLEAGINPDYELGRFLTERTTFGRTPKMAGALEYHQPGAAVVTLALVQEFIPNAVDGWSDALKALSAFYESVALFEEKLPEPDHPLFLRGACTRLARLLGRRTAQMHLALASDSHEPAFAPEPLTAPDLASARADVQRDIEAALRALRAHATTLPEAALLLETICSLTRREGAIDYIAGLVKIRCHGDYHLGQTLVTDDVVLLDFEGEPTRTIAQRRAKQSPLRDVAGMLRSLDYAAHAGLMAFEKKRLADGPRLEPWAELWQCWTSKAFLREYLATAAGAAFLPATDDQMQRLLRLFLLGKACYELVYELNNRPDWVRIPLRGLLGLLLTRKRE
jgi:maltose alpha-D-glucosyltransferase/alpha-amylase